MAAERDNQDELEVGEFFMAIAAVTAKRSKLTNQVGAVLVTNKRQIVGYGYNGTPLHHPDPGDKGVAFNCTFEDENDQFCSWTKDPEGSNDDFDWTRHQGSTRTRDTGPSGVHTTGVVAAQSNAILFATAPLKGTTMYTTQFPDRTAACHIVQAQVDWVHYLQQGPDVPHDVADILTTGKVEFKAFSPQNHEVIINFAELGSVRRATVPENPQE